jgi:hypothetical protein
LATASALDVAEAGTWTGRRAHLGALEQHALRRR